MRLDADLLRPDGQLIPLRVRDAIGREAQRQTDRRWRHRRTGKQRPVQSAHSLQRRLKTLRGKPERLRIRPVQQDEAIGAQQMRVLMQFDLARLRQQDKFSHRRSLVISLSVRCKSSALRRLHHRRRG